MKKGSMADQRAHALQKISEEEEENERERKISRCGMKASGVAIADGCGNSGLGAERNSVRENRSINRRSEIDINGWSAMADMSCMTAWLSHGIPG